MQLTKVPELRIGGRRISPGDLIRVAGGGKRLYRVTKIGGNGKRVWIDAFGPVDRDDHPKLDAKYRSFDPAAARSKARRS